MPWYKSNLKAIIPKFDNVLTYLIRNYFHEMVLKRFIHGIVIKRLRHISLTLKAKIKRKGDKFINVLLYNCIIISF
jgi:hypothetical protein